LQFIINDINIFIYEKEADLAKRAKQKEEDVEAYRHENEIRKNVVPVGLASYDTVTPKPKKYAYDPHLDPQLVWKLGSDIISYN
jgi:hypothetical protein